MMWKRLEAFLRGLFLKGRPAPAPAGPPAAGSSQAIRCELRALLDRRTRLRQAIACYRDFGYAALAREAAEYLEGVEARIRTYPAELLHEVDRRPGFVMP